MSETISVTPAKVQFIEADEAYSDVNGIIEGATVELDPHARSLKVRGKGREEKGAIEGDLIASARGVKITCGQEDGLRKSLHLAFTERSELDSLLEELTAAGLGVVRALDEDPDVRTAEETPRDAVAPSDGDTNVAADDKATVVDPGEDSSPG